MTSLPVSCPSHFRAISCTKGCCSPQHLRTDVRPFNYRSVIKDANKLSNMKKRDTEMAAAYLGVSISKGSEHRHSGSAGASGGSPFSISRFLSSRSRRRQHSKSRMSLDSESTRSESSLAAHNVASTSLPAFHSSIAAPPLPRSNNASAINSVVKNVSAGGPQSASSVSSIVSKKQGNGIEGPHRECPVCLTEQSADCFPPIQTCHHRSCVQCLRQYLQIEISESRVNIACPECNERFHPNDMRAILEDEILMGKYEDFMLRRVLAMDPDTRWCPAPDCGYAVIAAGCAGCPKLKCERVGCDTFFCYHCKQRWHPNQTCDAARAERSPNIRSASISYSHESSSQNEIKPCPRCGAFIVKMNDGSCNHMTCAVCAAEFCWLCMKEISDLHYLSPSGCTFWGRKPWSRKKKILWQLGTLVGAPVGITLVAGIAVPAMIIGIPVWVGRKIHARYRLASRHKRNLAITGGVAASILASPIIAGLAVGIGVPILLAYVYGVVPISLCRSGGCGVTTTNTGGVRFEFDEENEAAGQGNYAGDNHSETMPPVANPSIAPSIGDASLGMTNSLSASGSHMDRVGVLRDADSDRDSASNRAIAGASLNGSLCGSTYTNKLEVQVDVVASGGPQKRASFSSESANFSLSERSATVSFDEVSMRIAYSDGQGRDNGDAIASAEGNEAQDADVHTIDSADWVNSTPSGASATSPQSPHAPCRSGLGEEMKHGTKCKKLTRFVDDIAEITTPAACCKLEEVEVSRGESRSRDRRSSEQSPLREEPTLGPSVGFKEGPPVKRSYSQGRKEGAADRPKTICLTKERQIPLLRKSAAADVSDAEEIKHGGLESCPSGTGLCGAPPESATSHVTIGSDSGNAALPEVDTDKPVGPYQSSASTEDGSELQLLGSRGRSLSCFSLNKTSLEETAGVGETLSSAAGLTREKECCRPQQGSIRRHSYEQALQHDQTIPISLKLSQ